MNDTSLSMKFSRNDFIFCLLVSIICVMFFGHIDMLVTAQRAVIMIKDGNILDNVCHFYSECVSFAGMEGANYLPSTFFVFAVWNLPLRVFNLVPYKWGDWTLLFTLWNKMLLVAVFIFCGIIVYKISRECFSFSHNKAKTTVFLFFTSPIAFFSQFIFCQYDIFMLLFMLLGIYYYFKKDRTSKDYTKFLIYFGVSFTFKYFFILIFLVLLLMDTKKIDRILKSFLVMILPAAIEVLFYLLFDREQFISQVLEFGVLDYATQETNASVLGFSFNVLYLAIAVLLMFVYLGKWTSRNEKIKKFIFYSCGICSILFSLMFWHPQWLMFGVIFWTWAICFNRNYHIMLLLDVINIYAFYGYITDAGNFANNVDQNMLKYGFLSDLLRYRGLLGEADIMNKYFILDKKTLFTVLVCIWLFYFICSSTKYMMKNVNRELIGVKFLGYLRLASAVLFFVIPAGMSAYTMYQQPERIWGGYVAIDQSCVENVNISDNNLEQEVIVSSSEIQRICLYTLYDTELDKDTYLQMLILDENGNEVNSQKIGRNGIVNNGYTIFDFGRQKVDKNRKYCVKVLTNFHQPIYVSAVNYEEKKATFDIDARERYHDSENVLCGSTVKEKFTLSMVIYGD